MTPMDVPGMPALLVQAMPDLPLQDQLELAHILVAITQQEHALATILKERAQHQIALADLTVRELAAVAERQKQLDRFRAEFMARRERAQKG